MSILFYYIYKKSSEQQGVKKSCVFKFILHLRHSRTLNNTRSPQWLCGYMDYPLRSQVRRAKWRIFLAVLDIVPAY